MSPLKRSPMPPRRTRLASSGRPKAVNAKRKAREFARAYHSGERVEFVRSLPCVACGMTPCDNAHTKGEGMGRKGHFTTIVPLCSGPNGCHDHLHRTGIASFQDWYGVDLRAEAARIQTLWEARCRS